MLTFFDLFSGIGGFHLGMRKYKCVGACERDKYASEIYEKRFNIKPIPDATELRTNELPSFDVLTAGFPCQAFSIAGRRKGFEESRGQVFFEIARIAKDKQPKYLVLENVKGLLNHRKGETFERILRTLDEIGYDAEWQVLNTKHWLPQNRERVFIVGHLRGERTRKVFPIGGFHSQDYQKHLERGQECQIVNCIDANYYKGIDNHGQRSLVKVGNVDQQGHNSIWGRVYATSGISSTINAEGGGLGAKTGLYTVKALTERRTEESKAIRRDFLKRGVDWSPRRGKEMVTRDDGYANCVTANQGREQMILDMLDERIRRLMPIECERLQGFPDGWTDGYSDTQRYKCVGNAVSVPVVHAVTRWLDQI